MIYHLISFVIIFNNILLSLPITLTYYLISDSLFIQYTSLLSYYSFHSYLPISCLSGLNLFLFGLFYGVLQLMKAYKAEPV